MRPEIALAQAGTLRQWAENIDHEVGEGHSELAFLYRRAAKLAEAIADGGNGLDVPEHLDRPEKPPIADGVREG